MAARQGQQHRPQVGSAEPGPHVGEDHGRVTSR
jgi:hypothetical protein